MPTINYCKIDEGNFGDDLNLELWPRLFPDLESQQKEVLLYGIGTLLGGRNHPTGQKVILGSGFGYKRPIQLSPDWKTYWVRGPLTAQKLGLDKNFAITDPAILWSPLQSMAKESTSPTSGKTGLAPHFKTLSGFDWSSIATRSDVCLIDPRQSPERVAQQIANCDLLLAESLHAAIFADALRVPWIPIVLSHRFNIFKWKDWTTSIGVDFNPVIMSHYPHHNADKTGRQLKARILQGLGATGAISRHHGLRPVKGSKEQEIDLVIAELTALRKGAQAASLSHDETLKNLRHEMLNRCERFAKDFGLAFSDA